MFFIVSKRNKNNKNENENENEKIFYKNKKNIVTVSIYIMKKYSLKRKLSI